MEEGVVNLGEVGVLEYVYYMRYNIPENMPTKHVLWDGSEDSLFSRERAIGGERLRSNFPL